MKLEFPSELLPSLAQSITTDGRARLESLARSVAAAIAARAPHKENKLRQGIIVTPERSYTLGKIVFQIAMDPAKNDIFVKYSKAEKRYYYPASQEYGFKLRNGGRQPGLYFVKTTAVTAEPQVIETVNDITDKVLQGGMNNAKPD